MNRTNSELHALAQSILEADEEIDTVKGDLKLLRERREELADKLIAMANGLNQETIDFGEAQQ